MARFKMEDGSFVDADSYSIARAQYLAARQAAIMPQVTPPQVPVATIFKAVLTPVDNFAGRSKLRYGLGEEINLSFITTPPGQSAASVGGLRWVVVSGVATLDPPRCTDGLARLTCGGVAGSVKLNLVNGVDAVMVAASIVIVLPTDGRITQQPGTRVSHTSGTASAGFKGQIFFDPVDVSFYRCEFREGGSTYDGTGYYAMRSASLDEIRDGNIRHPIRAAWGPIERGGAQGSRISGFDTIESLPIQPPFSAGVFTWSIAWMLRMVGGSDEFIFTTADHVETLTAAGGMTISKKGTAITRNAADATSVF
jgi:hypothetical protein